MIHHSDDVRSSVEYIRRHSRQTPRIALVLGSGLGTFADELPNAFALSTSDIPHYPKSTVEGHRGRLVFGRLHGTELIAFQGRTHLYECNDLTKVLYPIHVAHTLGAKTLIVTNAAGGINRSFRPGDLMLITDQINLTFQRMDIVDDGSQINRGLYSKELLHLAERIAERSLISLKKGVYAAVKGPSYETASEVEMIHRLGGDAVGMSTVFEVALAARLGMQVLGISCITNFSTGISSEKLSHEEVTEVGRSVKTKFSELLSQIIREITKM